MFFMRAQYHGFTGRSTSIAPDIVIAQAGKPIAKLVPLDAGPSVVRFGLLRGTIEMSPDFDEPLPDDILDAFENVPGF